MSPNRHPKAIPWRTRWWTKFSEWRLLTVYVVDVMVDGRLKLIYEAPRLPVSLLKREGEATGRAYFKYI